MRSQAHTVYKKIQSWFQKREQVWFVLVAMAGTCAVAIGAIVASASTLLPTTTALWRFALGIPLCGLIHVLHHRKAVRKKSPTVQSWVFLILAGSSFAAGIATWFEAQELIPIAQAAALINTAPLFILCFGAFRGESVSTRVIVGSSIAIASVGGIVTMHSGDTAFALQGNLLGIVSAICYASYFLCVRKACASVSPTSVSLGVSVIAALTLLPYVLIRESSIMPQTVHEWVLLFGVAFFGQILGQMLLTIAVHHLRAFKVSSIALLEPIFAGIFAWVLFGQTLALVQIILIPLLLFGITLCLIPARGSSGTQDFALFATPDFLVHARKLFKRNRSSSP